jgi:DNA invertase Pin-like site-specific DNA recombinase
MQTIHAPRALVYDRVSKDRKQRASVADQSRANRQACDENGWAIAVVAEDNDLSASRYARKDRPGWGDVRAAVLAGQVDVVVLWESNRGDRKLPEWAAFLDDCRNRGVLIHVVSHRRTYDPAIARDWRSLAEDGVDSAYDSEKLSAGIRRGLAGAALRGQPHSNTPYGYRRVYDDKTGRFATLEPVSEQSPVVAEIIRRIGHHEAIYAIIRDLDTRGVPAPSGGTWDARTIRYMAKNPLYTGFLRGPDGNPVQGTWPAIVTETEWNAAVTVLTARAGTRPGKQRHLLTYLAECAECSGPVAVKKIRGEDQYSCRKGCFYAPYEWLNEWVSEVICARLARPDARDLFKSDNKRAADVRAELVKLERRHKEFCVKAARGKLSATALERIEEELLPEIEAARRERDALSLPPALREILTAPDVRKAWAGMDIRAQRAIIAAVTGVEVSKAASRAERMSTDRVEFTWKPVTRLGRAGVNWRN